jgi:hypothetical protein
VFADFFPDQYGSFLGVIVSTDVRAFGSASYASVIPNIPRRGIRSSSSTGESCRAKPGSHTRTRSASPSDSSRRNRREPRFTRPSDSRFRRKATFGNEEDPAKIRDV